jgi:hypothetical protein
MTRSNPTNAAGYVYILTNADYSLAKVGITFQADSAADRARAYSRAHGIKLRVFACYATQRAQEIERRAHRHLQARLFYTGSGAIEVFHMTPADAAFVVARMVIPLDAPLEAPLHIPPVLPIIARAELIRRRPIDMPPEWRMCLDYLLASKPSGHQATVKDRLIATRAQLIGGQIKPWGDLHTLRHLGLFLVLDALPLIPRRLTLAVADRHRALKSIFRGSQWHQEWGDHRVIPGGWPRALRQMPGARGAQSLPFAGGRSRAVLLPIDELLPINNTAG